DDARAVADGLDRRAYELEPLVVVDRRALAGGAGDDEAVAAVVDEVRGKPLEGVVVDGAVVAERRRDRGQDVPEHLSIVRSDPRAAECGRRRRHGRSATAPALLELGRDAVELRGGAVEPPAVPQQRDDGDDRDPGRPEAALRAAQEPDQRAGEERRQRGARLLDELPAEPRPPRRELGAGRAGEIGARGVELAARARDVDALEALREVLADLGGDALAVRVRDAQLERRRHDPTLARLDPDDAVRHRLACDLA